MISFSLCCGYCLSFSWIKIRPSSCALFSSSSRSHRMWTSPEVRFSLNFPFRLRSTQSLVFLFVYSGLFPTKMASAALYVVLHGLVLSTRNDRTENFGRQTLALKVVVWPLVVIVTATWPLGRNGEVKVNFYRPAWAACRPSAKVPAQ